MSVLGLVGPISVGLVLALTGEEVILCAIGNGGGPAVLFAVVLRVGPFASGLETAFDL